VDALELQAVERTLLDLASRYDGERLTQALDEFGWSQLLQVDPVDATDALFSAQGHSGSWSAALHEVLAAVSNPTGIEVGRSAILIPLPGIEDCSLPESAIGGLLVGARTDFDAVLAVGGVAGPARLHRIDRNDVSISPVSGLDDGLSIQYVHAASARGQAVAAGESVAQWWSTVVAAGRRALCFELSGAMEAMIELAVTHSTDRHQFGRPIGTFQAVRHRLAESRVTATSAHATARAAFDGHETDLASMAAKVVAGRAQRLVATHCQQVLAGVGFTAEHPFHRFMFRATAVDRLLGSATELAPVLGRRLIQRGEPVRLAEL
jgi:hypothetical protein